MKKRILYAALLAIFPLLFAGGLPKVDDAAWTDYSKALAQAKSENKIVLLDFTGSDWCPWCWKLDKEVFEQTKFKEFAAAHLVLVKLDFPRLTPQPEALAEQNERLRERYGVEAFPTVLVLNSRGQKIGELGYAEGGPDAFLAELAKLQP